MSWFVLNWHYSLLLLQLFQNKNFEKGEKGLFRTISDLSGWQTWKNKKETQKTTSMEFLDLCFTDSVDFSLYVQVQKLCQCQKEGNSSRHISETVFSIKWQLKLFYSILYCIGNRLLDKGSPYLELELLRNKFWINNCL